MNYHEKWEAAMSYADYRRLVKDLIGRNMSTGAVQSDSLLGYSKLNDHRMNRLDKTFEPGTEWVLLRGGKTSRILVITEGWCGDSAQIIPVIAKIADSLGIDLRCILRDEHPDLMAEHLSNGKRSIPILLFLDAKSHLLCSWGPRPAQLQARILEEKGRGVSHEEWKKNAQLWYNNDRQQSLQQEWLLALRSLLSLALPIVHVLLPTFMA
jgi:hypothetical protein